MEIAHQAADFLVLGDNLRLEAFGAAHGFVSERSKVSVNPISPHKRLRDGKGSLPC